MATDTFTCSRCGQVSYYRDGSYLFGQQIICARCYTAQAAPAAGQVPVAGLAATPAMAGFPGAPAPYVPPTRGTNVCGILGLICPLLALGCALFCFASLRPHIDDVKKFIEKAREHPNDQAQTQKEMQEWAEKHPELSGAITIGGCGTSVLLLVGLVLSIIGVCLGNVRKGTAIAGLVLNGLLVLSFCVAPCLLAGAMG